MDQINFFLWATKIASLSDEKWNLRTNAIVQGSKIVENEINSSWYFWKTCKINLQVF